MSAGQGGVKQGCSSWQASPCSPVASAVIRPVDLGCTADPSTFSSEKGNETDGFREQKSPLWSNIDIYFPILR